jgi:hypothetical protein
MKKGSSTLAVAVAALVALSLSPAQAKKWTVTQRQEKLSIEIDRAFKANQLTLDEADGMKKEAAKIATKEEKMKSKNGGKLSYSDDTELEKELNKLSVKLHKKMLEKRVQ